MCIWLSPPPTRQVTCTAPRPRRRQGSGCTLSTVAHSASPHQRKSTCKPFGCIGCGPKEKQKRSQHFNSIKLFKFSHNRFNLCSSTTRKTKRGCVRKQAGREEGGGAVDRHLATAYVGIRQHTSAYVSKRVHQRRIRQHTLTGTWRLHALTHVSIRQHTSAYVSIRQHTHTSAYVPIR